MSFIQIIVAIFNGFLDIILAIPRLLLWIYELLAATSNSANAKPTLEALKNELKKGDNLLKSFEKELKGIADIKLEAQNIIENTKNIDIKNNKDLFLEYVSAKAASPDFPLDPFSIDFAMFGKSPEFLFMVISAVLFLWIGGFFFRPIWRFSYTKINNFTFLFFFIE